MQRPRPPTGNELLLDNGNRDHVMSVLLGYKADRNQLSAQVRISGAGVSHRLIEVLLPMVSSLYYLYLYVPIGGDDKKSMCMLYLIQCHHHI